MSEEQTIEPTEQTQPLSQISTSTDYEEDSEDFNLDEVEKYINAQYKQDRALDNWQKFNPVFKQQQDIAKNLNDLLKKSEDFDENTFKDDTENYVKSIGMKVIQDTNPALAETIEKAKDFDENENFDEGLVDYIRDSIDPIIDAVELIKSKIKDGSSLRGWKNSYKPILTALEHFGWHKDKDFKLKFNLDNIDDVGAINTDELRAWLEQKLNKIETKQNLIKGYRTDLQKQMQEYKYNTSFTTNQKVAIDNRDEFYEIAKPTLETYKELITKYSEYLNPQVLTELEEKVKQINDYISDARLKGVSAGQMAEYTRLVNQVRKNVRDNYQNILTKMQAYSNSVSAEDAILNEIKSLASYEQYSQLPPAIFEKLPDEIKNKVMRLMELKAKLQKQQGKTKTISNKYKLNADNHPLSENSKPKLFNPMLNKGYSIHNKIAQHSLYNSSFA